MILLAPKHPSELQLNVSGEVKHSQVRTLTGVYLCFPWRWPTPLSQQVCSRCEHSLWAGNYDTDHKHTHVQLVPGPVCCRGTWIWYGSTYSSKISQTSSGLAHIQPKSSKLQCMLITAVVRFTVIFFLNLSKYYVGPLWQKEVVRVAVRGSEIKGQMQKATKWIGQNPSCASPNHFPLDPESWAWFCLSQMWWIT